MAEITFSKKQLTPVINKYSIDVDNDINFNKIITLFNGQTPYQIWALKLVFGDVCSIEVIEKIYQWINEFPTEIRNLVKGNIISYTKKDELAGLFNEMKGLMLLKDIREGVNAFNTRQRQMLTDALLKNVDGKTQNGLEAFNRRGELTEWANTFKKVLKLAPCRKQKLLSTSSALETVESIKDHITNALTETYDWNREDLLSYVEKQTPDCAVVFDNDNVIVLNVPSFKSSRSLCGKGRTSWCLTREERYFNQYVRDVSGAKQFFLFDFNLKENHKLAHIGFTVKNKQGVIYAHATDNGCMMDSGITVDNQRYNIYQALKRAKVPASVFMDLKKAKYDWNPNTIVKMVAKNSDEMQIVFNENNRMIVNCTSAKSASVFLSHTLINESTYNVNNKRAVYILFDFNYEMNHDNAIIVLIYEKDRYGSQSLNHMRDTFNSTLEKEYLTNIGINPNTLVIFNGIDPNILLHKFINENSEKDAIKLIDENKAINVNTAFENRLPIFNAIENKMLNLFNAIINHPTFDNNTTDGYGETILSTLLYTYTSLTNNEKEKRNVVDMINIILDSKNVDLNVQNINLDTVVNIACEEPSLLWVAERLINNPNVNVNVVNDMNRTALGCAIANKNIEALQLLGTRYDIVIRDADRKLAANVGIVLDTYIAPNSNSESNCLIDDDALDLSEIFAQAFGI